MLRGILIGLAGAAGAATLAIPGAALADPGAPPPPPNVNAYPPVSPADFTVMNGAWYGFGTPDGLTCVIQKANGNYGCSGPIPGAPNGANIVSGGPTGAPGFANADAPVFAAAGPVKPLPPNTRLSYRSISCATDGGGTTTCMNSAFQSGFVISPGGSFIVGETSPLIDRPQGTRPF
ncbi:hypothetical protein [Mycobacterium sp.]|uniref:hypothetical protein n=1 Tax=Mycobacterium sp. TaxID=1785 RepID=UPI002D4E0247|nr:hypothetical protein [Mycobacterium sp.]HZA09507.1 hypothetical protein [Mycobacterium sp.]